MSDKLQNFSQKVLGQAKRQYNDIINQANIEADEMIRDHENKCLEEAYKNIQKKVSEIRARESERVASVKRELQESLLKTREGMMNEVFGGVMDKIGAFLRSEDYRAFLFSSIKDAIGELGEGEKEIFIDRTDEKYLDDIKAEFKDCSISFLEEEALGGCVVLNKSSGILKNNTIAERLKLARREFVKNSGLIL